MSDLPIDVLTRRVAAAPTRRSLLRLLIAAIVAATAPARPVRAKDPHSGSDHGHGDHGGGGKHKGKKDKSCEKDGKNYAKLLDGLCIAQFYYDFVLAASCAACFDTCADHVAHCRTGDARACTEDCGQQWGLPVRYR